MDIKEYIDYIKFETTFFAIFHLLERLTELITEME